MVCELKGIDLKDGLIDLLHLNNYIFNNLYINIKQEGFKVIKL